MKHLYIVSAALALLFTAISCDRTNPFIGNTPFVTFSCEATLTVMEDAESLLIPVRALGDHGDFTVTVSNTDGTAITNTHYKIVEPTSGVLNFSSTDTLKNVVIELYHIAGYIAPGKVDFTMNIDNATGGLDRGSRRSVKVNITDADHPLKHFIGTWVGTHDSYFDGPTNFEIIVEADANDVNKLLFFDLCPYLASYGYRGPAEGEYDEESQTISIAAEQPVGYDGVSITGFDGNLCDIIVSADAESNTMTIENDYWGCHADGEEPSGGWYSLYMGPATFTRK